MGRGRIRVVHGRARRSACAGKLMDAHIATGVALLAAALFLGAIVVGYPLVPRSGLPWGRDLLPPARLLRGRPPRRRAAVGLLILSTVLSVTAFVVDTRSGGRTWIFGLTMLLAVENLVLLDISQHRREAEHTSRRGGTRTDEGE